MRRCAVRLKIQDRSEIPSPRLGSGCVTRSPIKASPVSSLFVMLFLRFVVVTVGCQVHIYHLIYATKKENVQIVKKTFFFRVWDWTKIENRKARPPMLFSSRIPSIG